MTADDINKLIDTMMEMIAGAPEVFAERFNVIATKGTPRFAAIQADRGDRAVALEVATRIAIDQRFYVTLLTDLKRRLNRNIDLKQRISDDLSKALIEAEHHAVFEPGGMWDIAWTDALRRVGPSIGVIRNTSLAEQYVGTGILVGPRLLLTAAHVVKSLVDFQNVPPSQLDGAETTVQVEFHHPRVVDQHFRPIVSKFDAQWLLSCSPPCGNPPVLDEDEELASTNLDFALIRLATPIGNVIGSVSIDSPPAANDNHMIALAGHLGGPSLRFHIGRLIKHHKQTKRIHHHANAAPGISGGPIIDARGMVVGIHEGATATYNRSVSLREIREVIRSGEQDPLLSDHTYVTWLPRSLSFNPLRLLGISSAEAELHPVVGRRDFQDWMSAAKDPSDRRRLAIVSGAEFSGKSLTGVITEAVADHNDDFFYGVSPEAARGTQIAELLENMAAVVNTRRSAGAVAYFRPDAGVLRHEIIPDGLSAIERAMKGVKARRFWLFIDFGSDLGWSASEQDAWKSFFGKALEKSWLRIVVSGISEGRQAEFRALFSPLVGVYCENLKALEWHQVEEFASAMIGTRIGAHEKGQNLARLKLGWERNVENQSPLERMTFTVETLNRLFDLITAMES